MLDLGLELGSRGSPPAALAGCSLERLEPVRPLGLDRLGVSAGDVGQRVQPTGSGGDPFAARARRYRSTSGRNRSGRPPITASISGRSYRPLGAPIPGYRRTHPGRQMPRRQRRGEYDAVQRSPMLALPASPGRPQQLDEQRQLLLEQLLVVAQVVAEERERLNRRSAAEDRCARPSDTASSVAKF